MYIPLTSARPLSLLLRQHTRTVTKYTKSHEWVNSETGKVGITQYAAKALGDVCYVEVGDVGTKVKKGDNFGAVESVKAASDIYSPVGGSILEKNDALLARFALLNEDPEGAGYIAKLKVEQTAELDDLMDRKSYDEFCRGIGSDQKD